jgi:hypothetical protein
MIRQPNRITTHQPNKDDDPLTRNPQTHDAVESIAASKKIHSSRKLPAWWWLLPLLLLVTWLGARGLNADGLWNDEWWSVRHAGGAQFGPLTLDEVWTRVMSTDPSSPPAYHMLLSLWGRLVGWTDFASRASSLLLGLLALALIYRLGVDLTRDKLVGLSAALVAGTGAFFVNYLHDLRFYTQMMLLTALVMWCYWQLVTRKPRWWIQIIFVLAMMALLYTHLFAALTLPAIALYHLLFVRKNRAWWRPVILMGIASASFIPWLRVLGFAVETIRFIPRANPTPAGLVSEALYLFSSANIALWLLLTINALRTRNRSLWLLLLWAAGIVALSVVTMLYSHTNEIRYMLGAWVPLALLVGVGVRNLKPFHGLALAAWLIAAVFYNFDATFLERVHSSYFHQPIREIAWVLTGQTRFGDVVAYQLYTDYEGFTQDRILEYYVYGLPVRPFTVVDMTAESDETYLQQVDAATTEAARVWVVATASLIPERMPLFEQGLIARGFEHCDTLNANPLNTIELYIRTPALRSVFFGTGAASIEAQVFEPLQVTTNAPDTRVLPAVIRWSLASDVPPDTYSVALHVNDANDQLVRQADYPLAAGCRSRELALNGLPAGTYRLYLIVYQWQNGERLAGAAADETPSERVLLTEFTLPE